MRVLAEQSVNRELTSDPTFQSWYVQLLSWLMETACDSALYYYYGDEGAESLAGYLTLHSDRRDGTEHPSPALRVAVLTAKKKSSLSKYKEPHGTSPAASTRKEAYLHFALQVRDAVFTELNSGTYDRTASDEVWRRSVTALDRKTPPNALDWPSAALLENPASVETGLVRSLWPTKAISTVNASPRQDEIEVVNRERRVDFAVDFLQFSHRFQAVSSTKIGAEAEQLANVLFLSERGVSKKETRANGVSSIDVRLGRHFIVFKRNEISTLNSLDAVAESEQIRERVEIGWGSAFVLHPGEMVLAVTLESIVLDGSCNAQVLSRSSLGRMGLLSATAVHVQPGFRGTLTLELVNLASVPLRLNPGQRIAQIVPSRVCGDAESYDGKYQDQDWRPKFSAVAGDWESSILRALREEDLHEDGIEGLTSR